MKSKEEIIAIINNNDRSKDKLATVIDSLVVREIPAIIFNEEQIKKINLLIDND